MLSRLRQARSSVRGVTPDATHACVHHLVVQQGIQRHLWCSTGHRVGHGRDVTTPAGCLTMALSRVMTCCLGKSRTVARAGECGAWQRVCAESTQATHLHSAWTLGFGLTWTPAPAQDRAVGVQSAEVQPGTCAEVRARRKAANRTHQAPSVAGDEVPHRVPARDTRDGRA